MNKLSFAVAASLSLVAMSGAAEARRAPIEYAGDQPPRSSSANDLAGGDARSYGYGASSSQGAVLDLRRAGDPPATTPSAGPTLANAQGQGTGQEQGQGQGRPAWLENERVGPPYQANGRWYVPAAEPGYEATGTASWYGPTFHGGRTASGEIYDQEAITAAHPTLPIPSLVQVTNLENGREVIVRVNDRGPFVADRILDLSHGAAQVLGVERTGTARVHIRYLGPAPRHFGDPASPPQTLAQTLAALPSSVQPIQNPIQNPGQNPIQNPGQNAVQNAGAEEGPTSLLPPAPAPTRPPEASPAPASSVQQVTYAPPAPMPVAAATGSYFVQVGAFSDVDNAQRVRSAVNNVGQAAVDVARNRAGAELFRVRVGPFANRAEAEAARRSVAALGYAESVVVAP